MKFLDDLKKDVYKIGNELDPLVAHAKPEHAAHWNRIPHPYMPVADMSKFWVITIISNPIRYKRRYELYWRFKEMCEAAGVKLITVEQAFGNRPFMVTRPDDPFNLQVRSLEELWHKENLINMGIKHACAIAPGGVREVAWVDADTRPMRPYKDWFEETWHQLQHYHFVQMWENMIDVDVDFNPISQAQPSFVSNYIKYGTPNPEDFSKISAQGKASGYGSSATIFGRPGLAWASTVDALNSVGGLIDWSILGAGDWYMAHGLVGSMEHTLKGFENMPRYAEKLREWERRCERYIQRDVGFVPGTVYHDFHGKKVNRFYGTRGKILSQNLYNPDTDIKYDAQGHLMLETWEPRQLRLRDEIRGYFRARNEDDISL